MGCTAASCCLLAPLILKTICDTLPFRYGAAYQTDPLHDYSVDPRVRLPQAAAAAPPAPDCAPGMPPRPQMASCRSTYQAELLDQPPSFNTCSAGGGSIRSTASAPVSPAAGAAARPGYLTTAAASQLPIAEAFAASFSLSAGSGPKIAALGSQTPQRPSNGANSSMPTAAARHGPTPELTAAAGGTACRPSKADAFLHALDQHTAPSTTWAWSCRRPPSSQPGAPPARRRCAPRAPSSTADARQAGAPGWLTGGCTGLACGPVA